MRCLRSRASALLVFAYLLKKKDTYEDQYFKFNYNNVKFYCQLYSFNKIFSRPLQALGSHKDILIVLSTSGKSKNIIEVLKLAKKKKIFSIGFLGSDGGIAKSLCDLKYIVPSANVASVQEVHMFLGHFIFEAVEDELIN